MSRGIAANVGACAVQGIGGLAKCEAWQVPTSSTLSTVKIDIMKHKLKFNTEPLHCTSTLLGDVRNDSTLHEAHGLEGFGRGSDVRPTSWCAGLRSQSIILFISSLLTSIVLIVVQLYELPKWIRLILILILICQPLAIVLINVRNKYKHYS